MEAVRRALATLGSDAKPTQMQGFIKNEFGIDMTTDHISTSKGELRRRAKARGKKAAATRAASKARAPQAAKASPGGAKVSNGRAGGGISLKDIEAVRDLVQRVGADQLRALIEVFGK
jgi:hypothetical protein